MIRRRHIPLPQRYRSRIQKSSYVYWFFAVVVMSVWYLWVWAWASWESIATQQAAIQHVCKNYTDVYRKATTLVQRIKLRNIYKKYCVIGNQDQANAEWTWSAKLWWGYQWKEDNAIWIQEFTTLSKRNQWAISILQDMKIHKQQDTQSIFVGLQKDTLLKSKTWKEVLPEQFDIVLKNKAERKSMWEMFTDKSIQFELWVAGEHLIFSKPVKIELPTDLPEGKIIDVLVLHEGDKEPNKTWLTENPDAVCISDWTVAKSDRLFTTTVKEWRIVFYTCWASLFTMNPVWWLAWSNDLKILIGDYWQVQLYYNNLTQIYGWNPPAAWAWWPSAWPILNVGRTEVGNSVWVAWTTASTTWQQIGNTYQAQTNLTYTTAWRTYTVVIDWTYTAPNKHFTWTYTLTIPTWNTQNVRFYYGMDTAVAGWDANDVGYYSTNPSLTVWVYDNAAWVLSAQRYVSWRMWSGYEAAWYSTISSRITSNVNYNNTVTSTAGDLWYGINWFFGTIAGIYTSTTEWRVAPYVATTVPDLIPWVWQPVPSLSVSWTSQIPVTITNVWNTWSNWVHTSIFYIPIWVNWPTSAFVSNGWSCGAMNVTARTVTCTKTMVLASNATDNFQVSVVPTSSVQWQTVRFTWYIYNASDSNMNNNTWYINLQVAVLPPQWNVTPLAPTHLTGTATTTSLSAQTIDMNFDQSVNQAFAVEDTKWNDSWYLATLELSWDLVAVTWWYTLPWSSIGIMGTPAVFLLSWTANSLVQPSIAASTPFRPLDTIQNLIRRNPWVNSNVKWTYWVYLPLRINIPAAQPAWLYQGTLIFTVIEI